MYRAMLDEQWERESLPADADSMAKLIGGTLREWRRSWLVLVANFTVLEDGRLQNARMEQQRAQQQSHREKAQRGGLAKAAQQQERGSDAPKSDRHEAGSGQGRGRDEAGTGQERGSSAPDSDRDGAGMRQRDFEKPRQKPQTEGPQALLRESSSSALHLHLPLHLQTASAPASEAAKASALVDPEIASRAGLLVERYGELFAEHRRGARHRARPSLDWTDACDLCRLWDDARLTKLATIVLTTDDPWIANTDRSFKIFALKATWADERLAAWAHEHGVAV